MSDGLCFAHLSHKEMDTSFFLKGWVWTRNRPSFLRWLQAVGWVCDARRPQIGRSVGSGPETDLAFCDGYEPWGGFVVPCTLKSVALSEGANR